MKINLKPCENSTFDELPQQISIDNVHLEFMQHPF
jgi:hypothetical protein